MKKKLRDMLRPNVDPCASFKGIEPVKTACKVSQMIYRPFVLSDEIEEWTPFAVRLEVNA